MMGQLVRMKVGFLIKALIAALIWAGEGFLTSVDSHMSLEIEV